MMVSGKKEGGAQAAASGLFCSVGRDVFCRDGGRELWQIVLPHDFDAFDLDPLAHPQSSPDGQHGAHVGISGAERYVCMVALPDPVARTLPTVLSRVVGMAWSPAGKRLCVSARDPSVGVLSMDGSQSSTALTVFSLFLAGKDDLDLTPLTDPIALPGIPRWSPAGDAVAVVGLERGGSQVALIVTTDGREGPLVSGERVLLGTAPWTGSGSLLCAVWERGGGVHVQLMDTATGAPSEQGEPWEDVCWLSVVGKRVLVAGKSGGAWCVADVTGGARTVLTASFASITDVAATAEHLWVVAAVESGELGLWSMDLRGEHLRLHIVAPSICGMQMRLDGRTVAVMAGSAGVETVQVVAIDDNEVLDIGRRDMIMGWIEEHLPHGRPPRLHYLLTPMFQPVDTPVMPSPPGDAETGTLELPDAPEALAPSAPLAPEEEGNEKAVSDDVAAQTVSAHGELMTALLLQPGQRCEDRTRWLRLVAVLAVIVVFVIAGIVMAVQHGKQADVAAEGTPTVSTPSTPSVSLPGDDIAGTSSAVVVTPKASSPTVVAEPPPATQPAIVTYGVRTGIWVACTERLRVRSAAGTSNRILGYLVVTERARVLSGPTLVGTIPWWHVRCYGTEGKARLTGWVSGEYVRPSSAPVVSPLAAPAASPKLPSAVKPAPVIKPVVTRPTTGTLVLTTVPSGASVAVNGSDRGVTPLSITLPDRETSITVRLAGYMDYTTTVTLKVGATVRVTWLLLPLGYAAH